MVAHILMVYCLVFGDLWALYLSFFTGNRYVMEGFI